MSGAEVLVGTLTQPLRMAVLHKSGVTEARHRLKSLISLEVPLTSLHTLLKQNSVRERAILVLFSKLVSVFLGALYPCGFSIIS